jgi:hypothetical protein
MELLIPFDFLEKISWNRRYNHNILKFHENVQVFMNIALYSWITIIMSASDQIPFWSNSSVSPTFWRAEWESARLGHTMLTTRRFQTPEPSWTMILGEIWRWRGSEDIKIGWLTPDVRGSGRWESHFTSWRQKRAERTLTGRHLDKEFEGNNWTFDDKSFVLEK